jgi:hypothetical protein
VQTKSFPIPTPTATEGVASAPTLSEPSRVLCWRLAQLVRAAYTDEAAIALATRLDVDLHQATRLPHRGCEHETALRILL